MAHDWQGYRLGDITEWSSGGTPSKSKEEYWYGDIPWISASSMDGNRYSNSKLKVTAAGLKSGTRLAPKDSILLLVRGSILHQKIQVGIAERDVSFNQDVKAIRPKGDIIDPWYLLFWFMAKSEELLGKVENTGIGAGKLDTKILHNLPISVPPITEQQRITGFAKALDDKIQLNRQTNQTLEAMAQALFKSWFVDFDPVIDNALAAGHEIPEPLLACAEQRKAFLSGESSDDTLPESLRQLFPNRFVLDAEMGWIPEGWAIGPLSSIAKLQTKSAHPAKEPETLWAHFSIPAFDENNSPSYDLGLEIKSGKYFVPRTAVLASKLNPDTPRVWLPEVVDQQTSVCSTEFMPFVPAQENHRAFLYALLCSEHVQTAICNRATGSTGSRQRVKPKEVAEMPVLIPTADLMSCFSEHASAMYEKSQTGRNDNLYLSKLRDTLLPKLISGELRLPVPETEDIHEQLHSAVV